MVASFLSSNVDKPNFVNSPPSIGCEDFYDEKAKQKKADLAESLGTDVGDKVHFHDKVYFHFARIVKKLDAQFLIPDCQGLGYGYRLLLLLELAPPPFPMS